MRRFAAALLAVLALAPAARAAPCPATAPAEIAQTIEDMYAAVSVNDAAKASAFMAPDFYLFEGGVRMSGPQILARMKELSAKGMAYAWSVTQPDVRVFCNDAFIAYVNKGSMTDAAGAHPLTWLESGLLHYDGKAWRIEVMQSVRAADAK